MTPTERAQSRSLITTYMRSRGTGLKALSRAIGSSPSSVSAALSGNLGKMTEAAADALLDQLLTAVEQHAEREPSGQTQWVMTRPATRMANAARRCIKTGAIGVAYGPSGVGKTETARWLARTENAAYVYVDSDSRHAGGLKLAIWRAVAPRAAPRKRVTVRDIVSALAGGGRLIIIDHAHRIGDQARHVVTDINDLCAQPILLVGTHRLYETVSDDAHTGGVHYGQFSRRIKIRSNLLPWRNGSFDGGEWIRPEQLRQMFDGPRLRLHPAVVRELTQMLNRGIVGMVGYVADLVENARLLAAKDSAGHIEITTERLTRARLYMDSERYYGSAQHVAQDGAEQEAATA